ncbi:hypothetical protein MKX01_018360, partial [Papaver californicum]
MFWLHFCRVQIAQVPQTSIDLVEIDVNSTGMRSSRDCDGDGQGERCSIEFHLS